MITDRNSTAALDLLELASVMEAAGDRLHAGQVKELRGKQQAGQFTAAFCGHFSAGKSTLINRLCGTMLLPSSPIPTSANVVSIHHGAPCATINQLVNGQQQQLQVPPEQLEAYCVNGAEFSSVDISYPLVHVGEQTVLLDTPGIDSTDDAHRMATESALHLADVVFYVMDYNHVQSEINFSFAKQLKDWGKPLYLIVNQIDKHREQELSFADYKRSVEESFANWGLEPAGILYLSLRHPEHPYQQWEALTRLLRELEALASPLNQASIAASAAHLAKEHVRWLEAGQSVERERLLAQAGGEEELAAVRDELTLLQLQLEERRAEAEHLRARLRLETQSLLDNANITPAATRDLAHSFLESRKPGFKAGFLFAGAKTAAEQQVRLDKFYEDFSEKVQAGIQWHLADLLRKEAQQLGWRDESLEERLAKQLSGIVTPELLLEQIQPGAVFSNEATMNYCRELAATVRSLFRRQALEIIDELADTAREAASAAAAQAEARITALAGEAQALTALAALDAALAAQRARMQPLLPQAPGAPAALPRPAAPAAAAQAPAAGASAAPAPQQHGVPQAAVPAAAQATPRAHAAARGADAAAALLAPQRRAAALLERAAGLLAPHEPLAAAADSMRGKAARLAQSRFTIALFGAFSAGKSSFANALLGERVLPVSPNPTTAAINRIVPPSGEYAHGTARIIMKARAALLDDLRYSLSLLGEEADGKSAPELLAAIRSLKPGDIHPGGRPHYSFLKAALNGWEEMEGLLDGELMVDTEDYRRYVAEESKSCFVQEIELYYDCPLTAQGIVLVDTPGADSVNARHTGVAFNYIKNADAILFVTYYNHAFSQADRQFLLQLGRVKDQFELDKMFFIVNAADLAADRKELDGVLSHVEANLLQHGIRHPRLFPMSSLAALDGKLTGDAELQQRSGIDEFEHAFLSFTSGELGQLAVASAEQDVQRSIDAVASWLASAEGDEHTRQAALGLLEQEEQQALESARRLAESTPFEPLAQELEELLHYVLQRLSFRFGDHFNYAFNPSALQDDGRDMKRMLWTCWLELQRLLQSELSEELLATSLRMENTMKKLVLSAYAAAAQEAAERMSALSVAPLTPLSLPTLEVGELWQTDRVDRKLLVAHFKNPRHFFEKDGKAQLRKELEQAIEEPLRSYADAKLQEWSGRYRLLWQELLADASGKLAGEVQRHKASRLSALSAVIEPEILRGLHAELVKLASEQ
ncbi:dynamin family protein [Paenibacillus sp. SYP-B4298]|uniref:dynamin family protein n=1 Tax=Paenibacillus sp. SYP-B4298 TaxID=2996034 RepID=UPI0022DE074A|nr:dynamin family protein [Paenibacillus sp. SYP-B4298]